MKNKVFVMLSGGVDSSVATARLLDAGFDVEAVYMQNWSTDNIANSKVRELLSSCSSGEDTAYAKTTADYLKIPFRAVNFEKEYWDKIIEPFFAGTKKGKTPNPDVWCNRFIKYGVFLDWAIKEGADYVASGHYARLCLANSKVKIQKSKLQFKIQNYPVHLLQGVDPAKDQSYFLAQVPKEKLKYALFPIGHLYKTQVRAEAMARGLPSAHRRDSQGLCFVGKVPIKEFLKERLKEKCGDVVLNDGTKIGEHDGCYFYTIGERIGFSINRNKLSENRNEFRKKKIENRKNLISNFRFPNGFRISDNQFLNSDFPPLYIIEKDIKRNILIVGPDDKTEPLWRKELMADSWNWFEEPKENVLYDVEIRYHQQPKSSGKILGIPITKSQIPNKFKIQNSKFKIKLEESVRAVTPGQVVVLSKGERIIGSGIIDNIEISY